MQHDFFSCCHILPNVRPVFSQNQPPRDPATASRGGGSGKKQGHRDGGRRERRCPIYMRNSGIAENIPRGLRKAWWSHRVFALSTVAAPMTRRVRRVLVAPLFLWWRAGVNFNRTGGTAAGAGRAVALGAREGGWSEWGENGPLAAASLIQANFRHHVTVDWIPICFFEIKDCDVGALRAFCASSRAGLGF